MSHSSAFFCGTACDLLAPALFYQPLTSCGCLDLGRSFSGKSTIQMPASLKIGEGSMNEVNSLMRHLGLVTSVEGKLVRVINSTIVPSRVRAN
jgi:hypothetical protein